MFKVFYKVTSKTTVNCSRKLDNKFEQIAVFHKQVNILCSIGSISRPRSWHNHKAKAADQAIAKDIYQSYFKKCDILFSGKQQGVRTNRKNYYLPI